MLGRAIVLVREDQLVAGHRPPRAECPSGQQALRLGHRNHDPRRARRADRAGRGRLLSGLDGVDENLAEKLVGEGFLSYDDLSVIEPDALMEMGGLTAEQAEHIAGQAEAKAKRPNKPPRMNAVDSERRSDWTLRPQQPLQSRPPRIHRPKRAHLPSPPIPPCRRRSPRTWRQRLRPRTSPKRSTKRGDVGVSAKGPRRPGTGRRWTWRVGGVRLTASSSHGGACESKGEGI